jgi:hypothetical protein
LKEKVSRRVGEFNTAKGKTELLELKMLGKIGEWMALIYVLDSASGRPSRRCAH